MSTKCTYMYGEGYNFYFDYKDMDYHLEFGNKEVKVPVAFKNDLRDLCAVRGSLEHVYRYLRKIEMMEAARMKENVRLMREHKKKVIKQIKGRK